MSEIWKTKKVDQDIEAFIRNNGPLAIKKWDKVAMVKYIKEQKYGTETLEECHISLMPMVME